SVSRAARAIRRLGGERGPTPAGRRVPALRGRGRGARDAAGIGPRRGIGGLRMKRGMDAFRREVVNLPNGITIGRLFLIPPVLVLMGSDETWRNVLASLLFATASGLDVLDGYLARKQGLVTVFGKFVDPLADKLMAMAVMIYLVALE